MKKQSLLFILILLISNQFCKSQSKETNFFHFDKAENDTLRHFDLTENLELKSDVPSNVVKGYFVRILIRKQFVEVPISGSRIGVQVINFYNEIKPRPKSFEIENITYHL